ncbi:hypothetical protein [Millisia brevis]|uniref:hypothetical protein n=1 Tax=Millisia brevis TaxID=264148 RepID=UPI000832E8E0|nr:hypothetical protein [Millisia brevis]
MSDLMIGMTLGTGLLAIAIAWTALRPAARSAVAFPDALVHELVSIGDGIGGGAPGGIPRHRIVDATPGRKVAYVVGTRVVVGAQCAEPTGDSTTFCAIVVDPERVGKLTAEVTSTLAATEHLGDPIYRDLDLLRRLSRSGASCVYVRGGDVDGEREADRQRIVCSYTLIEALAAVGVGRMVMATGTYPRVRDLDVRAHHDAAGDAIELVHHTVGEDPILEIGYALDWALRHDRDQPADRRILPGEAVSARLRIIDVAH